MVTSQHHFTQAAQSSALAGNKRDCLAMKRAELLQVLDGLQATPIHVTNAAFSHPDIERSAHEAIAAFSYQGRVEAGHIIVIAVNSTESMRGICAAKNTIMDMGQEALRLKNIRILAGIVAEQFPDNIVVLCGYDEDTPHDLYEHLHWAGFDIDSLYKYGVYGAGQNAPVIPGSEFATVTYSFSLNQGDKSLCEDITNTGDNAGIIRVDLQKTEPPMLTNNRRVAFELTPTADLILEAVNVLNEVGSTALPKAEPKAP
jgi:hypothetical protein